MALESFEELLLQSLRERRSDIGSDASLDAILKLVIETRESARKNGDIASYERITQKLQELGITLQEELRIKARITTD